MRIALYQMNTIWEDKAQNLAKVRLCLDLLKGRDIDLLLLPEMSLTGFSMNTKLTAESDNNDDMDSQTVYAIKKLCSEYNIPIGVGWAKACEDGLAENHYSIIGVSSDLLLDYAKIHPFSYAGEDKHFKGGDGLALLHSSEFILSTAICYDLRFGEIFTAMSNQGAELIIVPANWPDSRVMHWDTLLRARAIENQCYVAGVNCAGEIGGKLYSGHSAIYSPLGERIKPIATYAYRSDIQENDSLNFEETDYAEDIPDGVYIYELANDVADIRKSFPVRDDRRPDLYATL